MIDTHLEVLMQRATPPVEVRSTANEEFRYHMNRIISLEPHLELVNVVQAQQYLAVLMSKKICNGELREQDRVAFGKDALNLLCNIGHAVRGAIPESQHPPPTRPTAESQTQSLRKNMVVREALEAAEAGDALLTVAGHYRRAVVALRAV